MELHPGDRVVVRKTTTKRWEFLIYRRDRCEGRLDRGGHSRREARGKIQSLRSDGYNVDTTDFDG